MRWERWIVETLGDRHWGGGPKSPPGQSAELDFGEWDAGYRLVSPEMWPSGRPAHHANFHEDGGRFWLGTPTEWQFHCHASDALKLARFILWRYWAVGTWFGLKRRIWYWALGRMLERTRREVAFLSSHKPKGVG
jgi:hypothetical protein